MPSQEGNIIMKLEKGAPVFHTGEVSNTLSVLVLDSTLYCEPWLKVKLTKGEEGWIFGGAIDFEEEKIAYNDVRTEALLGKEIKDTLDLFIQNISAVQDHVGLEKAYQQAQRLQLLINQRLEKVSYDLTGPMGLPDLFWLGDIIPGFVPQIVAEGTSYYVFFDYRQWLAWARNTPGAEDEAFMSICTKVFPTDSIEYFFPSWTIQTWDYGGHSLLGRGLHFDLLNQLETYQSESSLFKMDIDNFRQQIIDDMTRGEVTFWEDSEKIKAEMDSIIAQNFSILTEADIVGLKVRRDQFEDPERHNIKLNLRAGE
jgi:hypothetical protein